MPDILPRRRLLLASATTLPLLLAAAGCRSSDAFAGPDPLAGPPQPAPDVVTLQAVIMAEENLIHLYQTAINGDSGATTRPQDLRPLLAEHEQHLARLKARLQGGPGGDRSPRGNSGGDRSPRGNSGGDRSPRGNTVSRLRAAEHASAASLVQRLATVEPALAQLFASIAASDATHVTALSTLGRR